MNTRRLLGCFTAGENRPLFSFPIHPSPGSTHTGLTQTGFSFVSLSLIICLFLFAGSHVLAGTTEDVVEGAGELSKFGIDVLEDFGLEGKTAEESGKARLEDLLKGKAKDFIKDTLTGGGDLSEGMGLILNKIFDGINSKKGLNACQIAALNQAWGIAFDAKNTRLLRGAANIWFDILTSIPGAPALAKKLVEETGEAAYKKLRSEIESKIKEAWAKQKDESFKLTKQSGPCSITMTVLWNKKKNKYLFLITGKCNCELVPIEPLGRGGTITMQSFGVIGGGTITPKIDLKDPENPKVYLSVGPALNIKVNANCDCAEQTFLPPPKEEPIDEWITAPRMEARVTKAKCEACQPLLDTVNGLVDDFNKLADRMDAIGKEVMAEKFKTPERDANIKEWEKLSKQQDDIQKKHDEVFIAFAKCEEEECKLGTGAVWFDEISTLGEQWTDCEECIPIMEAVNKLIGDYNKQVEALNTIASYASSAKLKLGTVEGNKAYRQWHQLKPALDALNANIQQKIAELSACKAKNCAGTRWQTWTKTRPISGTCTPCISYQESYNEEVKKYNTVIDKLNALQKKQQEYIEKHGESGAGQAGYEDLLEKEDLHGLLKSEREGREKLDRIKTELDACIEEKCQPTAAGDYISLGQDPDYISVEIIDTKIQIGNDPYDPRNPIAEDSSQIGSNATSVTTTTTTTSTPTPVATVQVINNIPISRLLLSGSDLGCPANHFHGAANNCNGVFTADPDSSGCGHGTVAAVISIPVTSCPDL